MDNTELRLKQLVADDEIDLEEMYVIVNDECLGDLDSVNTRETIEMFVKENIGKHFKVSHMLNVIEDSKCWLFSVWLGNPRDIPIPISTKEGLKRALGY